MVASSRESVEKACSVTDAGWEDHLNRAGPWGYQDSIKPRFQAFVCT